MKTTDLYDSRSPIIKTHGLDVWAYSFCDLHVDAGFQPEDPDHSRGYVRLELDRESEQCGGIATRVLRDAAVRKGSVHGELKDVLELHTKGDCETAALARALIFAGTQLLNGIRAAGNLEGLGGKGEVDPEVYSADMPVTNGVLHDSPSGSVWREAK